jgi:hypothetical protein
MLGSGFARPVKTLAALTLGGCLWSTATPVSTQSQPTSVRPIYYDDFETPWAIKVIVENDFTGLEDFEQQFLRAYMWGVDDFITTPPRRADPACARLADPVLHRQMQSLGFRAATDATRFDIRDPNVFAGLDAMARRMQSVKAAQRAGRDDMYLLAVDYGGCSGALVARFLNNIKAVASRGFP